MTKEQTTLSTFPLESQKNRVQGEIIRINGPIVHATGMHEVGMLEVVEVANLRLIGEVIRVEGDLATIQVYEDTTGVRPGEPVWGSGRPLSVALAPGILGNIYDGIQRPLADLERISGFYINRGEKPDPLPRSQLWNFIPRCQVGDFLNGGAIYGTVQETGAIEHRLLLPPLESGYVTWVAPEGSYRITDKILRLQDEQGREKEYSMLQYWPVRRPRPSKTRIQMDTPLLTGIRVIDTLFPIALGGTAAIPGGFGTGKTMTQHALAKWCTADIIVYIGCGERGNEMTEVLREFPELIDPRTGRSLMERTVLIANTSNMPVAAREVSIYTGITIAEYYRDMGYNVAIMADSTSRWAEALRELSGRLEEMPADEGFPAYLPSRLAEFYERGGRVRTLNGSYGSVSIIGAVSPPGGDFSEPVTQHTTRFIRCFWALDRDLANARHYPAISWLHSYSEYVPDIHNWWSEQDAEWDRYRTCLMTILQEEVGLQRIAKLVGADALPEHQRLILFIANLIKNAYLQQNVFDPVDMYCVPRKQIWMMRILVRLYELCNQAVHDGVALITIRELPCIERILRMKSTIPNDQLDQFQELYNQMEKEFTEIGRRSL